MLELSEDSNVRPREGTAAWPFRSVVSLDCQVTRELGVHLRPRVFSVLSLFLS